MSKLLSYFELAQHVAHQSNHRCHHHGAVLVKGSRIINTASNNTRYSSFASRFSPSTRSKQFATRHAELSVILNVPYALTNGASIYVVRVNNDDEFRYSKPCEMCQSVMEFVGIKNVYYSLNKEGFGRIKF